MFDLVPKRVDCLSAVLDRPHVFGNIIRPQCSILAPLVFGLHVHASPVLFVIVVLLRGGGHAFGG